MKRLWALPLLFTIHQAIADDSQTRLQTMSAERDVSFPSSLAWECLA